MDTSIQAQPQYQQRGRRLNSPNKDFFNAHKYAVDLVSSRK